MPLSVIFGQETYREDIDISAEEFYAKVKLLQSFQQVHNHL